MRIKLLMLSLIAMMYTAFAQYTVELPYKNTEVSNVNGNASFKGASVKGEPGQPALPSYTVSFLLPPNTDFKNVKISIEKPKTQVVENAIDVAPAAPYAISQSKVFWPKGKIIVNGRDQSVYNTADHFPKLNIGKVTFGKMRQYCIVDVEVIPYRYNPVKKELVALTGGTLTVTVPSSLSATVNAQAIAPNAEFEAKVRASVVNASVLSTYETKNVSTSATVEASAAATGRFVIITTSAIAAASTQLNSFIAAKQTKGFTVQLVTESTWGGSTGDAAANNIRTWLRNNYLSLNITNVLLIGNPTPSTGDVPMKMCWPRFSETEYRETPTDFYYADLSGNWDIDGDGNYGEFDHDYSVTGGPDRLAEVNVGRIPCYGSITELDKILAKTIAYQNETDKAWRRNVLLPMKPSDASTSGMLLAEQIKNNILVPNSYGFYRLGDTLFNGDGTTRFTDVSSLNPPVDMIPCTQDSVLKAWTNNQFGLVVWWTHGWSEGAVDIFTSGVTSGLNDSKPSFTFQVSCNNAEPEITTNLGYRLLENGSIGTVSATRVSWYWPGQTDYPNTPTNSGMSYDYAECMVTKKMTAGSALNNIKSDMPCDANVWWMNILDFCLYGSPDEELAAPQPVYLSDLAQVSPVNGLGPIEKDMSNGSSGTGDGLQLGLGNMLFTKGLGCNSYSEVTYNLNSGYRKFNSWIGVDKEVGTAGSVQFAVYADGAIVYNGSTRTGASAPQRISLNVSNVNQLRLVVNNADGSTANDHADWADAHLISGTSVPVYYTLSGLVSGNGTITVNPLKSSYSEGETVTLTANPFTGYQFTGWTGGATGTTNPITITMNGNKAITANFASVPSCTNLRMELESFTTSVSGYSTLSNGTKGPAATEYSNSTGKYAGGSGVRACQATFTGGSCTYGVSFRWYDKYVSETTSSYQIVIKNGSTEVLNSTWYANKTTVGWYNQTFSNINIQNGATITVYASRSSANDPAIMDYIDFTSTSTPPATYTLTKSVTGNGSILSNPIGSVFESGTVVTLTAVPSSGSTFSSWSGAVTGSTNPTTVTMSANRSVTAVFTSGTNYTVTYNGNGNTSGTVPATGTYASGATVTVASNTGTLVRTGYTFAGWNTNASGTGTSYTAGQTFTISANVTLYAVWTAAQRYTVTYNGNGNTGGIVPDTVTYASGATVTVASNTGSLVKTGYLFAGWNTKADGSGISYSAGSTFTISANTTLYTKWTSTATYTMAITVVGTGSVTKTPDKSYYNSGEVVVLTATPGTGYQFSSWSGDVVSSTNSVTVTMNANKSITVTFTSVPTYKVTYNGNSSTGGSVPTDANSYLSGASVTVLGNTGTLVRTGYTFAGWNTNASGTGTSYTAGQTFTISANVTLYARWTASTTYKVTYNGNGSTGGSVPTDANSYLSGATVTVLGNTGTLVRTGYTFAGWNTAAAGTGTTYAAGATFPISANVTLYALWNVNTATTIEAENTTYCSWSSAVVEKEHTGFTGTGYVNVANATGAWIQCNFTAPSAGTYTINVRYSNGGTAARGASLIVNGTTLTTGTFAITSAWTTYVNQTFTNVSLNAGVNTIRLAATTSAGPANIDRFDFSK